MDKLQPKVSVIIPVYNVEKYIEKCIHSLFLQTLDDLEYIFIDDCSPDKSIDILQNILQQYPQRKKQVKIIRHSNNLGVSKSRQDGVDAASGKYIIQCDPDDWVEVEMYESLYRKANEFDADIVLCDYNNVTKDEITPSDQYPNDLSSKSILDSITGTSKKQLQGAMWNKLIRTELYKRAEYLVGINFCENIFVIFQILQNENLRIEYVREKYYNYVIDRPGSLIKTINDDALQRDIKLIQAIMSTDFISNEYIVNKRSFIAMLIFRAMKYSTLTNSEFKKTYGDFLISVDCNCQIPSINKALLKIAMKGHLKISQKIHKILSSVYYIIRKI